jgi:hypothetical protein
MKANELTPLRTPMKTVRYELLGPPDQHDCEYDRTVILNSKCTVIDTSSKPKYHFTARASLSASVAILVIVFFTTLLTYTTERPTIAPYPKEGAAWSAIAQPLSLVDPESLGFIAIDRPEVSMPGAIFGDLLLANVPLPTNSWCENFFLGKSNTASMNRVFQLPYVIDTESLNGDTQGVNTNPAHVQANDRTVEVPNDLSERTPMRSISFTTSSFRSYL